MRKGSQLLINMLNNKKINQQVKMSAPVLNYVISPFEGNINPGDPQWLKFYL